MTVVIREERASDVVAIHDLTVAAFSNAPHTDNTEHLIVNALRHAGALTASLVAMENEQLIGHVALSPVRILDGTSESTSNWFGLGPVSVEPGMQGQGVGSKLVRAALKQLEVLRANGCVLLGEPEYYCRFGFSPLPGLVLPGVPIEYFQAIVLRGTPPTGTVFYHEAFQTTAG
ncbi:MAG: N-acetyltransferase [Pseudomonadota bacterium]